MKLEYFPEEKLKELIKKAVAKHLTPADYRLFFFGSRVRGNSSLRSDIDLGIESQKPLPAFIKLAIEEELENLPTLYKIELVDFGKVTANFKKEALKYTQPIN